MIKPVDLSRPFPPVREAVGHRAPPNPRNYEDTNVHRSVESKAIEHIYSALARVDRMAGFHDPRSPAWCELREAKQKLNEALVIVQKHVG